jgi:hypothetical protein
MQYYKQPGCPTSSLAVLQAAIQYNKQPAVLQAASSITSSQQHYKQPYSIASIQQYYKHLGNCSGNHTDNITLSQAIVNAARTRKRQL